MKKVYYFLFAALSLASCSSEDDFETTGNNSTDVTSNLSNPEIRSYDEALTIAKDAISMLEEDENTTRSGEPSRTINLANGVKTYSKNVTRSDGSVSNDPLLYVFNFNDDKGFAVVSANRATEGLLAVVENGSYDPNSKWDDSSFANECLENLKKYAEKAKSADKGVTRSTNAQGSELSSQYSSVDYDIVRDYVSINKIAPKLKVEWGQRGDIASWCPNKIAGSGPIALAQIMSFHKWPRHINLTHLDNRDNYQNWELMVTYKNSNAKIPSSFIQFPAFIREIGHRTGAKYLSNQTVTDISKLRSFMISQQYAVSDLFTLNLWVGVYSRGLTDMIKKLTKMSFIVVQANSVTKSGNTHTFVIDGCDYYYRSEMVYKKGTRELVDGSTTYNYLNHINWGEGGTYNGYYSVYALTEPTDEVFLTKDWNVTGDITNPNSGYFEGETSPTYDERTLKYFSTGR